MRGVLSLDHIVLIVKDLPTATRQFTEFGFTVTPGGVHAGGLTHNALIGLADGAYLELVASTRRSLPALLRLLQFTGTWQAYPPTRSPMGRRFLGLIANGPGPGDYALLAQDLEQILEACQARGLILEGPFPGSRQRPDGQQVSWRTAVPPTTDLPFLIEDVTPHDQRLPNKAAHQHRNQATGIAEITVTVADLERSATRYQVLLGIDDAAPTDATNDKARSVGFSLGENAVITLENPTRSDEQLSQRLAARQERPLRLNLSTASGKLLTLSHKFEIGFTLLASD